MTFGVWCLGYGALSASGRPGSAVSDEASRVAKLVAEVSQAAESSQALFGDRAAALDQLRALAQDCAEPGWDGDSACALDRAAVECAEEFLRALPDGLAMPELAADPDGAISFDWMRSRHRLFSLSIGRTGRLAYAWLEGAERGHAVAGFNGVIVPRHVIERIRAVVGDGNDSLRAA